MKTKLFKAMGIVAVVTIVGFNVYQVKSYQTSDLLSANIEALAQNKSREAVVVCSSSCRDGIGQCWTSCEDDPLYCKRTDSPKNHCSCTHLPG